MANPRLVTSSDPSETVERQIVHPAASWLRTPTRWRRWAMAESLRQPDNQPDQPKPTIETREDTDD